MRIETSEKGENILYCREAELICSDCGQIKPHAMYFCEANHKLRCYGCMLQHRHSEVELQSNIFEFKITKTVMEENNVKSKRD